MLFEKRKLAAVAAFILVISLMSISFVASFGGGGGGGGGTVTPPPPLPVGSYQQGGSVSIGWYAYTVYAREYYDSDEPGLIEEMTISGPSGTVKTWNNLGEGSGSVSWSIPNNAATGRYYISCSGTGDYNCGDSATNNQMFDVTAKPDNDPFGGAGGVENGQFRGWAQDPDCSGSVTPSSNGCPLDIHIYIDGAAGTGAYGTTGSADRTFSGTNKDNYAIDVPSQFKDGRSHTGYVYALGKDSSGNNNGHNPLIGTTTFTISQTCTSFTYSTWSTCYAGVQTRSVTSSSPSGCTGGDRQTTQGCLGGTGNYCLGNSQCSSGLVCIYNSCQVPTCTSFTYTAWGACSNGQQTRSVTSSSPSGCTGGSPLLTQACTSGLSGSCTSNSQCSSGLTCSSGTCKQTNVGLAGTCDANRICASTLTCTSGICQQSNVPSGSPCGTYQTCASGLTCSSGTCRDPTPQTHFICSNYQCVSVSGSGSNSCSTANDCKVQNVQVGSTCDANRLCASGLSCLNGVCKQTGVNAGGACDANRLCASTLTCSSGTCKQTGITLNGACDANRLCASGFVCTNGLCKANIGTSCSSGSSCASGLTCSSGVCKDPTQEHAACVNMQCKTVSGSGSNSCFSDSGCFSSLGGACSSNIGCTSGLTCSSGTCKQTNVGVGGACDANKLCSSGLTCTAGQCKQSNVGLGGACDANKLCSSGLTCDASVCKQTGVALDGACDANRICSPGLTCQNGVCKAQQGTACTQEANCVSGLFCRQGTCTNNQCAGVTCISPPNSLCYISPGTCGAGSCTYTMKPVGTSCGTDQQCSASGSCTTIQPIQSATWSTLDDKVLFGGDAFDSFKAIATGTNLSGRNVEFKVYKDSLFDSLILTQNSTIGYVVVQINDSGNYYFTASLPGSPAAAVQSATLAVSSTPNNAAPIPSIIKPVAAGIYFVDSPIELVDNSTDADDRIVSTSWTFSDGGSASGSATSHSFTTEGAKTIRLRVTDSRGTYADSSVDILVVSTGTKVSAYLGQPQNKQAIISDNLVLSYSAVGSFAIQINSTGVCSFTISCIAGNCPLTTQNSPSCAPNQPIPITGSPKGYSELEFNWTFREGNNIAHSVKGIGKTTGNVGFASYGVKNLTLLVKYAQNVSSSVNSEFTLFNQRQCNVPGNLWSSVQNGVITGSYDTLSSSFCTGLDSQAATNDDCCPVGYYCSTGLNPGCKLDADSNGTLRQCKDYDTQQACSADPSQRVRNDPLWELYSCGRNVDGTNVLCSCAWDTPTASCVFYSTARTMADPLNGTLSGCTYTTETSTCVDGYQTVSITATLTSGSDPTCVDSSQVLPCGRPVIALPFFAAWQALSALVAIALIYLTYSRIFSRRK